MTSSYIDDLLSPLIYKWTTVKGNFGNRMQNVQLHIFKQINSDTEYCQHSIVYWLLRPEIFLYSKVRYFY